MIRNKCLLHAKHAQHDPRVGKIVSSEDKLTGLNRRNTNHLDEVAVKNALFSATTNLKE